MTVFTGILQEIADLCGPDAASAIQAEFGGREMNVPSNPARTPNARLCQIIGVDMAETISREIGAGRINVPIGGQSSTKAYFRERASSVSCLAAW